MDMTPRMKQIFRVLLKEEGAISVKELASRIAVSKRTVQREMEYMNRSLRGYDIDFVSKTGVGIWLEGSQEEKKRLLADISDGDDYDVSNREERRKRLILEILKEKGLKKLFYYSASAGVSEATVSTDLEAVEEWLNRYGLKVVRKPGSGILVDGTEENYRRAIRAFINENIDTKVIRDAYEGELSGESGQFDMLKKSNIGQILNDDIMRRVMDCIVGMDDVRVLTLTENSYVGLVIHISIAINRILKNEVIEDDGRWNGNEKQDEDYQLAQSIVRELEAEFEIQIPDVEIAYICLHIKGAKHEKIQWSGKSTVSMENRELQQLVNDMIDAYDSENAGTDG